MYEELVALTGIEPDGWRFSSVQPGLSVGFFRPGGIPRWSGTPPRTADVTARSQRSRRPTGVRGRGRSLGPKQYRSIWSLDDARVSYSQERGIIACGNLQGTAGG